MTCGDENIGAGKDWFTVYWGAEEMAVDSAEVEVAMTRGIGLIIV
jgi:hypothetical protein